jgi:hypothetical protein
VGVGWGWVGVGVCVGRVGWVGGRERVGERCGERAVRRTSGAAGGASCRVFWGVGGALLVQGIASANQTHVGVG